MKPNKYLIKTYRFFRGRFSPFPLKNRLIPGSRAHNKFRFVVLAPSNLRQVIASFCFDASPHFIIEIKTNRNKKRWGLGGRFFFSPIILQNQSNHSSHQKLFGIDQIYPIVPSTLVLLLQEPKQFLFLILYY